MNAVDHKCPACSAPLPFNPVTGTWKCEYCASEYKLEDLEKNEQKYEQAEVKNEENTKSKTMDVDEYKCPNCGATIITDENTTATFCVYCGSTTVIKNRLTGVLQPEYIIPFKTTKQQAIEAFKTCRKGKLFTPKDFAKKEQIEKITGVYIPFWLYDCTSDGDVNFRGTKVKTWRSGDYRYTKTDTYRMSRSGNIEFEKVPVDGAQKFDDDTMDSIEPFDYKELSEFSPSYLSGFLAEKYDIGADEACNRAKFRMKNTFKDEMQKDVIGYTSVTTSSESINMEITDKKYVLLPVWMLNIKYKNKMHTFAMNGQTGKMIGNIPISIPKAILWALGVCGGSFGILTLISYFF